MLHERGPLKAAVLAGALGIAPSTLTRLANRLVRDGLVDRHADPEDRRAVVLATTERGNDACDDVKAWRLRKLAAAYAGATRVERIELARALSRVGELFTEEEE